MVVAISLAKFIADYATHPLYHTLIEIKCMPLLPQLPVRRSNALDLVPITQLMHSPPVVIQVGPFPLPPALSSLSSIPVSFNTRFAGQNNALFRTIKSKIWYFIFVA